LTGNGIFSIFYIIANISILSIWREPQLSSIIIVCPQKHEREKIVSLLSSERDINILAQGKDGYDALKLVGNHKPDIAILDNNLEFIDGEEIPPLLRIRSPSTAFVIVVAKISDYQIYKAASNEVSGIVNKEADLDSLPEILKDVSEGKCFISPVIAGKVLRLLCSLTFKGSGSFGLGESKSQAKPAEAGEVLFLAGEDPAEYLSKMELRILVEIGEGHTSSEIAKNLGLAVGTVRNYISSVMHKTGMNNRPKMVRYAYSCGLVPLPLF
jgi:two-component system response regulator DegU